MSEGISLDRFLALFDGPSRAIPCARDVHEPYGSLGLRTRAGLPTGMCEIVDGDASGIASHRASRILDETGPGEILMSNTTRDRHAGSGITLEDRAPRTLRGIPYEQNRHSVK